MELEKFVDQLPIMKTAAPKLRNNDETYYEITMKEFYQKLHRDLRPTRLWGYDGQYPGPTIQAAKGEKVKIKWKNNLPDKHFLPVDKSIHHLSHEPEVRTVVHLHGMETRPESDGYPEAWYTKGFKQVGPFFEQEVYEYPNHQRAATLWYHDHAMGITRLNVYAGLAGMYILNDKQEQSLKLPSGKYDVPLLIQDRSFHADGSLSYPNGPANRTAPIPANSHADHGSGRNDNVFPVPSIIPFFLGDTILVNGKVWPYLRVEPRKYRFRILNGSNSRGYELYLDSEQPFNQIASDGGLLSNTIQLDKFSMEPAERVEVIIDFTKFAGQKITLKNDLGPNADPNDRTADIMQFHVDLPLSGEDTSRIPKRLSTIPSLLQNEIKTIRHLKLTGTTDSFDRPLLLLDNKKWHDPVTEKPILGATEIWSLINTTNFQHPIHIHLVQFQVLGHQPFDLDLYNETGQVRPTGPILPSKVNERGWKDTVSAPAAQITRVIAKFAPYAGQFVWHCHILEHEDYDMMRPFRVVDEKTWNKDEDGHQH